MIPLCEEARDGKSGGRLLAFREKERVKPPALFCLAGRAGLAFEEDCHFFVVACSDSEPVLPGVTLVPS